MIKVTDLYLKRPWSAVIYYGKWPRVIGIKGLKVEKLAGFKIDRKSTY